MGFSGSLSPALLSLMAEAKADIALSCPNTTVFNLFSKSRKTSASSFETFLGGMRAILATTASISFWPIFRRLLLSDNKCWAAPASSITSIALSGSFRSLIYLDANSTAVLIASEVYLTL